MGQVEHIIQAVRYLRQSYPELEVIGLWVDEMWQVSEVQWDSFPPAGGS